MSVTAEPSAVTGVSFPFHLYKSRADRSPRARRDFDFLWSDTYKSRFRMPLDSLSGAEQINDLQRLAESVDEVVGNNPFAHLWTDLQLAYNMLSRAESYRATTYSSSPLDPIGFKVAQPTYPDVERSHIDAYIYAPSFAGFSQWPTYIGDRQASDSNADLSNPGQFPSAFTSSAEDSLTGHRDDPQVGNSVMIPGPLPNGVAATGPTRWTRPGGTANAYLVHESTHAINLDALGGTGFLHMFASGAEVVTGASTDAPRFDVDYHFTLGVTGDNLGNAYPHWQSFMAYLAFNWRGADTTAGGWQDDLLPRWSKGPATERDLSGLARRLRDSECAECATYPGFVGLDSLARVQRLIHDWRVADYVNGPALAGGYYGFPAQFGFSPANQLGSWQDIDVAADNNVSMPPVFTVSGSPSGRAQWLSGRPAGPGATSRAFNLQMHGAEYLVFKADPVATPAGQNLLVRVRPDLALLHAIDKSTTCVTLLDEMRAGRLHASVVSYSQASDSLFRHPEWATSVVTQSMLLDSLRADLEFTIPAFGSTTRAVLVVLTLGDGPTGWFSRTGEGLRPTKVEVGAWLVDSSVQVNPIVIAGTAQGESAPAWSPDGARLVYQRRELDGSTRVYLKNSDGSGVAMPLRSATHRQAGPVWSPRGDRVAYLEGDSTQMWFVNVATGLASPSAYGYMSGRHHDLAYSPDGGRVAYMRDLLLTTTGSEDPPHENDPHRPEALGYRNEIHVRDAESGADTLVFWVQRALTDSTGTIQGLQWTADSRYLTFSRFDGVSDTVHHLQLDTRTQAVTEHDAQAPGAFTRAFSPGEGPVLVQATRKVPYVTLANAFASLFCHIADGVTLRDDHRIAVRDTLAGTATPLGTSVGAVLSQPRWSPDGTKVAYVSTRGDNSDIYVQQARPDRAPNMFNTLQSYYAFPNCTGYNVNFGATDPDGDAVTYRAFGLPPGATLGTSPQVVWPAPVVGDYWFTIQALDPAGAVDSRVVHFNVYDGGDCGGGGGGEGEGEILLGHGARQADPNRVVGPGGALPKAVNSFLDGVAPGEWASQSARLSAVERDSSGHYIAKVVGLCPGEFKLDRARLLVVDHDASVVPVATDDGVVVGAKRAPATMAVLGGNGATDGLLAAGTTITLAWADLDSVAGVLLNCARAGAVPNDAPWGVVVEVREGDGWREADVIKPRAGYDALASSLSGVREVRLRFLSDVYVREIAGYAWSASQQANMTSVACVGASIPGAVDSLGTTDGSSLRLVRGASAALVFDAPAEAEGRQRTLFLEYVAAFVPGGAAAGQTRASGGGIAGRFALHPTSPNPFERSAQIRFELPLSSRVLLEVFDAQGRRVRTLADRLFEPGEHALEWDGSGANGRRLGPGVYLVRMRSGAFRAERRMVRLGH